MTSYCCDWASAQKLFLSQLCLPKPEILSGVIHTQEKLSWIKQCALFWSDLVLLLYKMKNKTPAKFHDIVVSLTISGFISHSCYSFITLSQSHTTKHFGSICRFMSVLDSKLIKENADATKFRWKWCTIQIFFKLGTNPYI